MSLNPPVKRFKHRQFLNKTVLGKSVESDGKRKDRTDLGKRKNSFLEGMNDVLLITYNINF